MLDIMFLTLALLCLICASLVNSLMLLGNSLGCCIGSDCRVLDIGATGYRAEFKSGESVIMNRRLLKCC